MRNRQKWLMVSLSALIVANMAALPSTLAALNELVGGGGKIDHEFCGGCSQILPKLSPDQIRHLVGKQVSKTSGAQRDEEWVVSPNQVGGLSGVLPRCSNPIDSGTQTWCEAPSIFSICWWRGLNIENKRNVCIYRGKLFCCGRWRYAGCSSCQAGAEPPCIVHGHSRCDCNDCP